uniref:Alternative protein KCNMB3 n=1 Tax=Homo sapiens TaxID=9606 RepID=L8E9P7_HUMAN|nr:alternative protein KCNMB3 [Homo sapiens]
MPTGLRPLCWTLLFTRHPALRECISSFAGAGLQAQWREERRNEGTLMQNHEWPERRRRRVRGAKKP